MQKDERFLPPKITRFNYWELDIALPRPLHHLKPTSQRLGEYPGENSWTDLRPGDGALERHIQAEFQIAMRDCPFQALYEFVSDNKSWHQYQPAQEVRKQLSPEERAQIDRWAKTRWPPRSQRPERVTRTWTKLFKDIANDIKFFEHLCNIPPRSGELEGTPHKVYKAYSKQAIWLLGGGKSIDPECRGLYQDLFDSSSTLLTPGGRLPSESIYDVNWLTLSRAERRAAKKRTIHWFQHALRTLREYRNRRSPIPWGPDCEQECSRIHKKILMTKF